MRTRSFNCTKEDVFVQKCLFEFGRYQTVGRRSAIRPALVAAGGCPRGAGSGRAPASGGTEERRDVRQWRGARRARGRSGWQSIVTYGYRRRRGAAAGDGNFGVAAAAPRRIAHHNLTSICGITERYECAAAGGRAATTP